MHITITGDLGSGKSTVAKILRDKHGYEIYSVGQAMRDLAAERGMDVLEFNKVMMSDFNYDTMLDKKVASHAFNSKGKDVVFDSRLAWKFVPHSFKVYITVDPNVALERVCNDERGSTEKYSSNCEAFAALKERKKLENRRFKVHYNVDVEDWNNYDLVIDSTSASPSYIAETILDTIKYKLKERILLDPKRLYPTQSIRDINPEYVKKLEKEGFPYSNIIFTRVGSYIFIKDGHHRVAAAISYNSEFISGVESTDNTLYLFHENSAYYDWEDFNHIKFKDYPTTSILQENQTCLMCDTKLLTTGICPECGYKDKEIK